MEPKPGVFILSNNRLLRESIERLVRKKADLNLIAARSVESDSKEEVVRSGAEVLVSDSLPFVLEAGGWREASVEDRQEAEIKVVLVAMDEDKKNFLSAVKHGVLGYVLLDAPAVEIVSTIRVVARGEAVCPPHFARVLFDRIASETKEFPNARRRRQWGLTRREQQLVPLIGRGMTNKEIAGQLNLSEETVKSHVHRILQKVGVDDRLEVLEACQTDSALR
jgi:DNA-binding NarL/FixJ family response regulator